MGVCVALAGNPRPPPHTALSPPLTKRADYTDGGAQACRFQRSSGIDINQCRCLLCRCRRRCPAHRHPRLPRQKPFRLVCVAGPSVLEILAMLYFQFGKGCRV